MISCWLYSERRLLAMKFVGQMVIDIIIFILAAAFSVVIVGHIIMLWSLRRNFFIVLR